MVRNGVLMALFWIDSQNSGVDIMKIYYYFFLNIFVWRAIHLSTCLWLQKIATNVVPEDSSAPSMWWIVCSNSAAGVA